MRAVILLEAEQQDQEVHGPQYCLKTLGWDITFAGPEAYQVYTGKHGIKTQAERAFHNLSVPDYDAVVVPGGWGAEKLRMNQYVLSFVKAMHAQGRVIAAICHGPWVLCSIGHDVCLCEPDMAKWHEQVHGTKPKSNRRKMTCYRGMKDDLIAAGAEYVEVPVVVDGNVITSPHYDFVPEFVKAIHDAATKQRRTKKPSVLGSIAELIAPEVGGEG